MNAVLALGRMISRLLTYDFCPWANRWVYWMKHPIASLSLAAVAALVCAIFIKPVAMVAFVAVAIVLVLGYLWPSIVVRGLVCAVRFPQRRVTEGELVRVVVRVSNRWPWPVWGIAIEEGFDAPSSANCDRHECDGSIAFARVAGWSTSEFEWEFVPKCRGEYPLATPRLVTGFPFGLQKSSRPVTVEQTLLVWPQIIPLDTLLDAAETRPSEELFSDHRIGDSGDMTGTRLFRDGDSLRRVHWAQTARQGRMIVCERQAAAQSAIRVVFDSDPLLHRGTGFGGTLEWSIRIAASVCAAYQRENAQVECCFGHRTIPLPPGTQGMKTFLDALAKWRPCDHQHGWPGQKLRSETCLAQTASHASQHGNCDHAQAASYSHRTPHRNCGAFQLTITTDLGLERRTGYRHAQGEQRMIVLRAEAFERPCEICGSEHYPTNRRSIVLDRPEDVVADFRRKWRQVCHAG